MRSQTSLAAALIALGGAGVAFAESDRRAGGLSGLSSHATTDGVSVVRSNAGDYEIRLSPDVLPDGAPDPRIGFAKERRSVESADFEPMQKSESAQTYLAFADIAASEFDTIPVWPSHASGALGAAAII